MPSGDKVRLAILASGSGSNADAICAYFHDHPHICVSLIITNRAQAGVRLVAQKHDVTCLYVPKPQWKESGQVLADLQKHAITHIILAGFLLLVPSWLIQTYPGRIINIHPALLPFHGGKGMYGMHVHEAVKAAGDSVTGITIHEVNDRFDEGRILFQKEIPIDPNDTPQDIARNVLRIEHEYYPSVIEQWASNL